MKTTEENRETFEEIVFSDRNKEYGAYMIRQEYTKTLSRGLMVSVTMLLFAIAIPLIAGMYSPVVIAPPEVFVEGELANLKDKKDEIKPPEIPDEKRPLENEERYLPPVVTIDTTNLDPHAFDPGAFSGRGNGTISANDTTTGGTRELPPVIEAPEIAKVYTVVNEMPEFPGGEGAMLLFIRNNIVYPREAREIGINGTVYLSFVVSEKGHIVDVSILRAIGGGCENEAVRVISSMPDWKPGKQGGIAVKVRFNMPVKFELN